MNHHIYKLLKVISIIKKTRGYIALHSENESLNIGSSLTNSCESSFKAVVSNKFTSLWWWVCSSAENIKATCVQSKKQQLNRKQ
jgi:hypothetical protein